MVKPVVAFDIRPDGRAVAVAEADPAPSAGDGFAYRWLHFDVAAPGLREWAEARLPALAAATLLQAETRPRCDEIGGGVALNLRGVNLNPEARSEDMVSLRIWAGEGVVVSARIRRVMTVDALRQRFEAGEAPPDPARLLAAIAEGLTDRMEVVSLELEERTDALEEAEIGGEVVAPDEVAALRRAVAMLRRFASPQREALARLTDLETAPMTPEARLLTREVANRAARNAEALEALRERLAVLQDHIDARAAQAMGRNSYVLGVAAAVFLPLGFLTGLFGVNVGGMPGVEDPSAFWWLAGAMAAIGLGLTAVFRWMRWF